MSAPPRRLFLLDGHSLAYRAFFALPQTLATSSGTVTNAVYGFTSMLIKLFGDEHPDLIAVAFDMGAPTVRLELDADYKAGRAEAPDRLPPPAGPDRRGARRPADPGDPDGGPRGRRRDRHAGDPGERGGARRGDRHRRPGLLPAGARPGDRGGARSACCSTGGASPRSTGWTPRRSRRATASRPRSTSTSWRSRATPPTTSRGCPGIGDKTAAKLVQHVRIRRGAARAHRRAQRQAEGEHRRRRGPAGAEQAARADRHRPRAGPVAPRTA